VGCPTWYPTRLRQVHPHNPISLNKEDALALGIAIEHGYGHKQLGAAPQWVDGKPMPHNPKHGNGVNLNNLGFADPTRPEKDNIWVDWVSGAAVRQALPARVEKVV